MAPDIQYGSRTDVLLAYSCGPKEVRKMSPPWILLGVLGGQGASEKEGEK